MNIALVGASGSGKSKLATQLVEHLDDTGIVDNYVEEIEDETNIAIGSIIDYVGNLAVVIGRYGRENLTRSRHKNVITCGTIFESSIYYAAHVAAFRETSSEEALQEYAPRVDASLRIMACFYNDIMPYDHIFYLRLGNGTKDAEFIDQQLQVAVGGFALRDMKALDVETDSGSRCKRVLEVISETPNS